MAAKYSLNIGLFDPGMSHLHRVGLAGLYMTLDRLQKTGGLPEGLSCSIGPHRVTVDWTNGGAKAVSDFFTASFRISQGSTKGLIDLAAHRGLRMGDIEKIELHRAVLGSFLQHNRQNKIPKGTQNRTVQLEIDDQQVVVAYRPLAKTYAHAKATSLFVNKKGSAKESVTIKGWLFPGAAERHMGFSNTTTIEEPAERAICLLFAPVAPLYYRLSHRKPDGRFDERRGIAVCLPHITNLEQYARCYARYLESPVQRLYANGPGDAGLSALISLKAQEALDELGLTGCTVITIGTVDWNKRQSTRTGVATIDNIPEETLSTFEIALRCLPNRVLVKSQRAAQSNGGEIKTYFVAPSLCRGLIADNISKGKDWFRDFGQLMLSKNLARLVGFERGGLGKMVREMEWSQEADRLLVDAVHAAIRNRYGALAARAKERGEAIRFGREFERMRTGLMRAKNAATLRAELADLFARGGLNKTLQREWQRVLPLFTGCDWQRARDLALLGLASYTGRGAEEMEMQEEGDEEVQG